MIETHQRVDAAIAAFARGELIVVTDDDDRENEGDLFCAASLCTPEKMAFMIRHTSGIVCAPLDAADARRLHLNPLSVVAGTHVSTPPVGPLLIASGVGVGHLIIHGRWISIAAWPTSFHQWIHLLASLMVEWTVGSLVVGLVLGTMVFFAASALLKMVAVERD